MTTLDIPIAPTSARPIWLTTLADLALLLVGFFVFLQSAQHLDRDRLVSGIRTGFGIADTGGDGPIPVSAGAMRGFAPGSARLPSSIDALVGWAKEAARDPRVTLRVTGSVDGSAADVDSTTSSGAVLAADRARAVAAALARAGVVESDRIVIVNASANAPRARDVIVTLGFGGVGR